MTPPREVDVVIVGAGHAGVALVSQLSKARYAGSVVVLESQSCLPYERPPLSKAYVTGDVTDEDLVLRSDRYWSDASAELLLGTTVTGVNARQRVVSTDAHGEFRYGSLVWAAGADPRRLPLEGADAPNVLSLRTLADARTLKALAENARNAVIIGGGYIGLEVASTLRKLRIDVTLVELQDRILARVAGARVSAWFQARHEREGVRFRLGAGVAAFDVEDGRVTKVRLNDGSCIEADLVLVGVGVVPRDEALIACGADAGNGLIVDDECRTSLPGVYAIGDVAGQLTEYTNGTVMRIESVPNTTEQARLVAAALAGAVAPSRGVPWFWSNQYDVRLQTAGILLGFDEEVVRGRPSGESIVVGYFREGTLIAADCVNAPRDFNVIRSLIAKSAVVDPKDFADSDFDLLRQSSASVSSA